MEFEEEKVASFTDAWIETGLSVTPSDIERVASFTDAWIETLISLISDISLLSHLLQMRGLKLLMKVLRL